MTTAFSEYSIPGKLRWLADEVLDAGGEVLDPAETASAANTLREVAGELQELLDELAATLGRPQRAFGMETHLAESCGLDDIYTSVLDAKAKTR